MMSWLTIKTKLIGLGAIALSVIAFFLRFKYVKSQRDKFRGQAKQYKAQVERQADIQDIDNELEGQLISRKAEIKKEIKEGKSVKSLEKPNEDW